MLSEEITSSLVLRPRGAMGLQRLPDRSLPLIGQRASKLRTMLFHSTIDRVHGHLPPHFHCPDQVLNHWNQITHTPSNRHERKNWISSCRQKAARCTQP